MALADVEPQTQPVNQLGTSSSTGLSTIGLAHVSCVVGNLLCFFVLPWRPSNFTCEMQYLSSFDNNNFDFFLFKRFYKNEDL